MEARSAVDDTVLRREAWSVLNANRAGSATVPAPGLYPHQWNGDSTFVALGLARLDARRAGAELLSLLAGQWRTGMVPHIVFQAVRTDAYFPGPSIWRSQECRASPRGVLTSGLTQPPLQALALWRIWRHATDRDEAVALVRRLYPMLVAQNAYLATRDLGGGGLAAIVHPWESGMDDSPVWDAPLEALTPIRPICHRKGLPGRLLDGHHDPYVWLALRYRDSGYDGAYLREDHPFAVEDPMFNGIWLASCEALAELAPLVGADPRPHRERAERIRAGLLERLWADDVFRARDLRTGRLSSVRTVGCFGPMLDPGLPSGPVASLVSLLESPRFMGTAGYPVPSCEIRSSRFDRTRYWRGPSWVNTNWLLRWAATVHGLDGLARILGVCTLRLVRQAGFRECFDPFDGSGRGSRDFSWSAALTLDLLADTVEA